MEVVDSLTAVMAGVHDQPVAMVEMVISSHGACLGEQGAKQRGVFRQRVRVRGDVALRDDQHVHGSLRIDVCKGDDVRSLMEACRGDSP